MIAMGCKYLRICHLNNCATGIATQNKELYTRHFKPNGVAKVCRYFRFLAREVREYLAILGVRSLAELIGRTELLEIKEAVVEHGRDLRLGVLLESPPGLEQAARHCVEERNQPFDRGLLAERMVADALPAVERSESIDLAYEVKNHHRSIGARLSGEIARRHGNQGLSQHPVKLRLRGTAGQSLGAWNAGGLEIYLEGDANDYVGKGMAGGAHRDRAAPEAPLPRSGLGGDGQRLPVRGHRRFVIRGGQRRRALCRAQLGRDRGA